MECEGLITACIPLQLCAMHELDGHRFCRYHELGQYVFGPKLGFWIVLPCQLTMMIGLGIVYSVTGGLSMHRSAPLAHAQNLYNCTSSCPSFFRQCCAQCEEHQRAFSSRLC